MPLASGATVLDVLEAFLKWIKGNRVVGLLLSGGVIGGVEVVAKWVHFEGFSVSPRYLLSMSIGLLSVLATLFAWWTRGNPQRQPGGSTSLTDASGKAYVPRSEPIFGKGGRAAARWLGVAAPVIGGALVYAALPSPNYPLPALRHLIAAIDDQRGRMRDDSHGLLTLYTRYRIARAKDGERFWNNPVVATSIPTADVVEHNHQLRSVILGELVPGGLRAYVQTPKSGDLAHDIARLVEHFNTADQVRSHIESLEERASPSDFAAAQDANSEICRYWELILMDTTQPTGLTSFDRPGVVLAEAHVRGWLNLHKEN
jgi:hypothetical protein